MTPRIRKHGRDWLRITDHKGRAITILRHDLVALARYWFTREELERALRWMTDRVGSVAGMMQQIYPDTKQRKGLGGAPHPFFKAISKKAGKLDFGKFGYQPRRAR